jgi:MoaA/NifB/PqqE/SkfB family radical SAM enzyme
MNIHALHRRLDPQNPIRVFGRWLRSSFATNRSSHHENTASVPTAADGFRHILMDIVGGCNAKCPFCVTGREDFGKRLSFTRVEDFARTLDRLIELRLATPNHSVIGLFNWGEPILHPDLDGIVRAINARDLYLSISTNASKATRFTVPTDRFLDVVFSVPGWSQASYDKIHGLRFDRIVANMEATMQNMRSTGYHAAFNLAFHVYKFNWKDELPAARAWCSENGVNFQPYYAFINDYRQLKSFLDGTINAKDREQISESLFLHYVRDLISSQPTDWVCPQWKGQLTLNHKCEVLPCCALPLDHPDAVLGSVFTLSREEILAGKVGAKECTDCLSSGANYWMHNFKPFGSSPDDDEATIVKGQPSDNDIT